MKILRKIIRKLFAITTLPEGDYLAKINNVQIVHEGKNVRKLFFIT